jgi:acetyl/propionyl-CoA carboxylase alpha subunit
MAALRQFPILGVRTNVAFLINILEHSRFAAGEIDTGFLDRAAQEVRPRATADAPPGAQALAAAVRDEQTPIAGSRAPAFPDPWTALRGTRV